MSPLAKILLYLAVVVLAAAILSPPIYWLVHGVLDHPFHRYFSRVAQVSAIVLLVPLLFWLRIRSPREFGLERNVHPARDFLSGLGIAIAPVVLLGIGYFVFDVYRFHPEWEFAKLARIAGTAVVVAAVEEFLFRGVALGLAARLIGGCRAALAVSLVFAGVHFLKPARQPDEVVHWWSGFSQLSSVFGALPAPAVLGFAFVSLFVAGLILASAALRTHSLWLPIGLHAGWILGQQGLQWVGKTRAKPGDAFLPWVGPNVVSGAVPTGLLPLFALLLTALAVWLYLRHAPDRKNSRGS